MKSPLVLLLSALALPLVSCGGTGASSTIEGSSISSSLASSSSDSSSLTLKGAFQALRDGASFNLSHYLGMDLLASFAYTGSSLSGRNPEGTSSWLFYDDGTGVYSAEGNGSSYVASTYYEGAVSLDDLDGEELVLLKGESRYSFLSELGDDAPSYVITDKSFRLALVAFLGYDEKEFTAVKSIAASYEDQVMTMSFAYEGETHVVEISNIGTAEDEVLADFLQSGGKPYEPASELAEMKRLVEASNFVQLFYDETGSVGAYQVFNPDYFYAEQLSYNEATGSYSPGLGTSYGEKDGKIYAISPIGTVYDAASQSFDPSLLTDAAVYPMPVAEGSIEEVYHYPMYLELLSNLGYLKDSGLPNYVAGFEAQGHFYLADKADLAMDFALNFSIDQSYDLTEYIPMSIGVDLVWGEDDASTVIDFVLFLQGNGNIYAMDFPFTYFGEANLPAIEAVLAAI